MDERDCSGRLVVTENGKRLGEVKGIKTENGNVEEVHIFGLNNKYFPDTRSSFVIIAPGKDVLNVDDMVIVRNRALKEIKNILYDCKEDFLDSLKRERDQNGLNDDYTLEDSNLVKRYRMLNRRLSNSCEALDFEDSVMDLKKVKNFKSDFRDFRDLILELDEERKLNKTRLHLEKANEMLDELDRLENKALKRKGHSFHVDKFKDFFKTISKFSVLAKASNLAFTREFKQKILFSNAVSRESFSEDFEDPSEK